MASRLKHMNTISRGSQCFLLRPLGYAVRIRFGQVNLLEALDHLHNLHLF